MTLKAMWDPGEIPGTENNINENWCNEFEVWLIFKHQCQNVGGLVAEGIWFQSEPKCMKTWKQTEE